MKAKSSVFVAALLLFGCGTASTADAARQDQIVPYSEQALSQALSRGEVVVIESYASWCAPCRIQAPIVAKLLREPRYREVTIIRVGEKTPKAAWRKLGLVGFGTMIVYRRGKEVARGQPTTEVAIRALLSSGT